MDKVPQLLQQFPNSIILYNIQGAANKGLGQLEAAIDSYKQAINIKPEYADTHNNMGNALNEQGKLEEAIEAFNKALAIKPDYAEAYNNMGHALKEIVFRKPNPGLQRQSRQYLITKHILDLQKFQRPQ